MAEQVSHETAKGERVCSESSQIARVASYVHEIDHGTVSCSAELCWIFGIDPSTFRGTHAHLMERVHPDDRERIVERDRALAPDHTPYGEFRIVRSDGTVRIIRHWAHPVADAQGRTVRVYATLQELADRCQAENEHRALEVRFARAFDSAPFGMSMVSVRPDSLGRFVNANQAYCEMIGYAQEELQTISVSSVVHPADAERNDRLLRDMSAGSATLIECELRMVRRDGGLIWVYQRRSLVRDDSGRPFYVFAHSEDVTRRRADQAALADANQRLYHCFENAPIAMALLSVDPADPGRFLEANKAACRLSGYSREQLLRLRIQDGTHPDDLGGDARAMQRLIAGEVESVEDEKRIIRPDGAIMWGLVQRSILRDSDGKPLYCVAQVVDITERKRVQEQLRHLADHDALTDLLNRRGFERILQRHLDEVWRYGRSSALLLIDLDHFKYVNDTLGHPAGDELLRKIGGAFARRCRSSDILARLGGDEFAVILLETDATSAQNVASDLCRIVRDEASVGNEQKMRVSASIGVLPLDAATRLTAEEAMVAVDIAMYQAKDAGRDRVRLVDCNS